MAFEIRWRDDGAIEMIGRCDASRAETLESFLAEVDDGAVVDMARLSYVSSLGLGLLFAAQKRLMDRDRSLRLKNLTPHIRELFSIAGFDAIFEIEED